MYGSSLRIETWRPRALSSRPTLAAVMPLPREEVTPPVTKTYFAMVRTSGGFSNAIEKSLRGQAVSASGRPLPSRPATQGSISHAPPRRIRGTAERARPEPESAGDSMDGGTAMEFVEVVMKRRAVRRFEQGGVPRETIERIARLAQRAPSAGFSQGQRLVVVTDPERRREVARVWLE